MNVTGVTIIALIMLEYGLKEDREQIKSDKICVNLRNLWTVLTETAPIQSPLHFPVLFMNFIKNHLPYEAFV